MLTHGIIKYTLYMHFIYHTNNEQHLVEPLCALDDKEFPDAGKLREIHTELFCNQ